MCDYNPFTHEIKIKKTFILEEKLHIYLKLHSMHTKKVSGKIQLAV